MIPLGIVLLGVAIIPVTSAELLPTLELRPNGFVYFTNETKTRSSVNYFSFYFKINDVYEEKQQIIDIKSQIRTEQFIRVSVLRGEISVLINMQHPASTRWIVMKDKIQPDEVYYLKVLQNGTDLGITLNNVTLTKTVERVEDFVSPSLISIGSSELTPGINGSIAGLEFNGVKVLHSYVKRDSDFRNVQVQIGGDLRVEQQEWTTIYERDRIFCPHNNLFPKSEQGTEIKFDCQQGISRAVCGANKIWVVERCDDSNTATPEDRQDRDDGAGGLTSADSWLIYIGIGGAGIVIVTIAIIVILVRRNKRQKIHRYKMAQSGEPPFGNPDAYITRLNGISTLPVKLDGSSTASHQPHLPLVRRSLEMSCSTLDNLPHNSDILDNRIPVFAASSNPLSKQEELYPVYLDPVGEGTARDQDIISTILGERPERNYTNPHLYTSQQQQHPSGYIPSTLLTSTTGLNSEAGSSNPPWNDV